MTFFETQIQDQLARWKNELEEIEEKLDRADSQDAYNYGLKKRHTEIRVEIDRSEKILKNLAALNRGPAA